MDNASGEFKKYKINLSTVYIPFGIKQWENKYSDIPTYNVSCNVSDPNTVKELVSVDEYLEENINKNLSYSKLYRDNKDFPKLLTFQLPTDNYGNFMFAIFKEDSVTKIEPTLENIEDIFSKGKRLNCMISCNKLWENAEKCGSNWQLIQCKVFDDKETSAEHEETDDFETCLL
jgi:hypothetical protein